MRALAVVTGACMALAFAGAAQATFPGSNGAIAYTFWGTTEPEVSAFELRVRAPGAQPTTIFRCVYSYDLQNDPPCHELMHPSWSPDGHWIAATELGSFESGARRLVVLRGDGTALRRLPPLTSVREPDGGRTQTESNPSWSPDGSRLVFAGERGFNDLDNRRSNIDIYVVGADGTGLRRLTRARAGDDDPVWSVRGRIAFTRTRRDRQDIYTIRPNGSDLERVTDRGGTEPSWSPDGTRLAFARRGSIYVVGADGRGLRRVTRRDGDNQPVWSPDGTRIAFIRAWAEPEVHRIYTIGADGRGLRMVTSTTFGMPLGPIDWQALTAT